MLEIHARVAMAMVLYYAVLGIWGLVVAARKAEISGGYHGALIIGVGLGVIQALVGLFLVLTGLRPLDNLHFLYGASVIVTLPLVLSYIVDKKFSRPLAFGLASLFMAGLSIRAITTGGSL